MSKIKNACITKKVRIIHDTDLKWWRARESNP